jgi:hypothetical protein
MGTNAAPTPTVVAAFVASLVAAALPLEALSAQTVAMEARFRSCQVGAGAERIEFAPQNDNCSEAP